jgi:hypothetical protein
LLFLDLLESKGEDVMDFIERVFRIAPDGGSGATELMIFSGVVLIAIVVALRRMTAAACSGNT